MMENMNSETWTYKGLALLKGGKKLGHVWVGPDGIDAVFSAKRERFSIGATYDAKVDRHAAGVTLHGTPKYVNSGVADPAWVLDSRAAEATLEQQRAEKRAKGAVNFDALTIGEVRTMMARQLPSTKAGTLAAVLLALGVR